ncbi:P-loop NTPase fold protein [Sphingomonas sp. 37zxx]|uniref:P-loop NTPase fold protein n=1 Tax=Sphingomonas sp. 37zxx TaxID=1550073 RepID=UPI000B139D08|nr:P-loop NTPase fold protein [Sphingomonas sp. 37zxx]
MDQPRREAANAHIREYLKFYLSLSHPPLYAVLLSGRWGVGKTYHAKRIIGDLLEEASLTVPTGLFGRRNTKNRKRYVLVSLYGLQSPQEIDDAMVASLYPWTTDDGIRIAAGVGKAVLRYANIDLPQIKSSDLINRLSADVFIFDDLERCAMKATDSLGYINQLVERDGCKVVILANESELDSDPEYRKGKEKVVGKTLTVQSDFEPAFSAFLDSTHDNEARQFLREQRCEVQTIYMQSELDNLRILQQTVWDFARVYSAIASDYRSNSDAMKHLIRLFFALSFEYKVGNISNDDLRERSKRALSGGSASDKPAPFVAAARKYIGLYFHDTILSDEVAFDIVVRGVVDPARIAQSLDDSSFFASQNEPAWRTLWHSTERSDDDVKAASKTLLEEFSHRKYRITGEVLHVFGQILWLADAEIIDWDRARAVAECKSYVDDLERKGELESPRSAPFDDIRYGSFSGLGFAQENTSDFKQIWAYLAQRREASAVARLPERAQQLIELMCSDQEAFARQIAQHRDGPAEFANVPVFASCDPTVFSDRIVGLTPYALRAALMALSMRYDMGTLSRHLSAERHWAENLEKELLSTAKRLPPITRDRINTNVRWTLSKRLAEVREFEKQQELV